MARTRVTLKYLAETLGIHVSTVSRALHGDEDTARDAASPETVKKIRDLAQQLHYRPNILARNFRAQQGKEIAVLMPRLSDPVMATVYDGIASAAQEAGYGAFVANTFDDSKKQLELAHRAVQMRVAGMIISDMRVGEKQQVLDMLTEHEIPYVLVYRRHQEHLSVTSDNVLGGRLVAEHLYANGHRHVGVLAGEEYIQSSLDRVKGFCDFFLENGIQIPSSAKIYGAYDVPAGRELGSQLLNRHRNLSAVFAVNDFLAIGLMGVIRDLNLEVGKNLAVVGYNDIPIAAELHIPLSSVQVPLFAIGRLATELLLARIDGKSVASLCLDPVLHVRDSSSQPLKPIS
jgi:LacI family transcriptional regulator